MNKTLLKTLKYIALLGIGFVFLWRAYKGVDLNSILNKIEDANLFWLSLSITASLIALFSRAIRWNLIINTLGYKPRLNNTCVALMVGYISNLAFPRLGEVTRCGTLTRTENVPFDKLIGTVVLERTIDLLCLLICTFYVALSEYDRLGNLMHENITLPLKEKVFSLFNSSLFIIGILVTIVFFLIIFIKRKHKKKESFSKTIDAARKIVKGIIDGFIAITKMQKPLLFIFHTVLIWFMYFLMSYLCFHALNSTSMLDWHAAMFVLVAGSWGMSAPVNGGFGIYHTFVSQGLVSYNIQYPDAITFATLMHGSQTLLVIILGGLAFLYLFLKERNGTAISHTEKNS